MSKNIGWIVPAPGRSDMRTFTILLGLKTETRFGMRLTGKAPSCFKLCQEYGLTFPRNAEKIHVYEAFAVGIGKDFVRFDRDAEGKVMELPEGPRRIDRPAVKVTRARKRLDAGNETVTNA